MLCSNEIVGTDAYAHGRESIVWIGGRELG